MLPLTATGPNITLRYPAPTDAPRLYELARDPAVTRYFSWRYAALEDAERWIAARENARALGEWLEFVVDHGEHGVVGITGLTEPSRRDARAVTGSWLGSAYWGTGINDEAKAPLRKELEDMQGIIVAAGPEFFHAGEKEIDGIGSDRTNSRR